MPEAIAAALVYVAPELGAAIAPGLGITTTYAGALGSTIFGVGLSVGLSYVGGLLAPKPGTSSSNGNQIVIRQALPHRKRSYGKIKIGGAIGFEEVDGGGVTLRGGATVESNLWIQQLTGQGEIDLVAEHWLDDNQVLLNGSGFISTGTWADGHGYPNSNNVLIVPKLGAIDQTAHADLITAFGPDFTADHRWGGVPNVLLYFRAPANAGQAASLYPQGPPPYRQVQQSALLYDPRDGVQIADGDPDRPRDNNWAYSGLAGLVLLDYLRHPDGYRRKKDRAMVPIAKFRLSDWIAYINTCDEDVPRKGGGTEKRWRLAGTYDMTTPPKNVLQGMLDACDAEIYRHRDGTIGIRGGAWSAPTFTIDDSVKPGVIEHRLSRGRGKNTACNIINAKYTSERHDYQQMDMDPWIDQDNIDLRGEELSVDLDLSWAPSHGQARRIAKIQMAKRNPGWSGTIIGGPVALSAFNQRIGTFAIAELGIADTFMLPGFKPDASLARTELTVSAFGAPAYVWTVAEEGVRPAISVVTMDDSDIPVPTSVTAAVIFDADVGGFVASEAWANVSGFTLYYQAQYRVTGGGPDDWINMDVPDDSVSGESDIIDATLDYDFQVRSITAAGKASLWAVPASVAYPLVDDDGNALVDDDGNAIMNEAA